MSLKTEFVGEEWICTLRKPNRVFLSYAPTEAEAKIYCSELFRDHCQKNLNAQDLYHREAFNADLN